MKHELKKHLLPLLPVFVITTIVWIFAKAPWYQFVYLFLGLGVGSFLLDVDHLVYWFYTHPNLEESKLARLAIAKKDFKSVITILENTHKTHTNLTFHHYLFQIILAILSFFIFSSSNNAFGQALILALNIHLLVDQYEDLKTNPKHLQNWLFARSTKQIPLAYLPEYLYFFTALALIFFLLLIK